MVSYWGSVDFVKFMKISDDDSVCATVCIYMYL